MWLSESSRNVLVDEECDGDSWHDFSKISCDTLIEPPHTFMSVGLKNEKFRHFFSL